MCSRKTLGLLKFMNGISYKLRLLPFRITLIEDGSAARLDYDGNSRVSICKFATFAQIMCKVIVTFCIGLPYDLIYAQADGVSMGARVRFYLLISVSIMAIIMQALLLFRPKSVFHAQAAFYGLLRRQSKILQLDPNASDGITLILRLFIFVVFFTSACFVPVSYFGKHVYALLRTRHKPLNILISSAIAMGVFLDWLSVFQFMTLWLTYMNAASRLLKSLLCQSPTHTRKCTPEGALATYRAHQVMHLLAMGELRYVLAAGICVGSLILIMALFLVIGFHVSVGIDVILVASLVSLITFVLVGGCMQLSSSVCQLSGRFSESYLGNEVALRKCTQRGFRASPPLRVGAAGFISISKQSFLYLMSDVVVQSVVNLLLLKQ